MAPELESSTLVGEDTTAHERAGDSARVLALTIIWHPDLRRVGERALFPTHRAGVSRTAPLFNLRQMAGQGGKSLDDPYLSSRAPAFTVSPTRGGFEVAPGTPEAHIKIASERLSGPRLISEQDLSEGVIVVLARRIVLCLHRARLDTLPHVPDHGLVGGSDSVDECRREIQKVADLDVPVLISGETGTGKGRVATAIVAASRRPKPFLAVNMGSLASTAAAELFGYERGAFTGAVAAKEGFFAAANTGSLFLDEVGLLPLDLQKAILRALEEREILPLGSTRPRHIDVRIIAATDIELPRAIADGKFSAALFERLARYEIALAPLRHRREDFGLLLLHFLRSACEKHHEPPRFDQLKSGETPWLSAAAVATLAAYGWPRNVRQLENVATKIVTFNRGQQTASLPPAVRELLVATPAPPPSAVPPGALASRDPVATPSPEQVADALVKSGGSAKRAAAALRVSRTTFYELRKRNPLLRSLADVSDEELVSCRNECAGDVSQMADRLRVPLKALKDRLARLPRPPR